MRAENGKKNGIFGGLIWTFGERISAQLVSAIVGIILARLLMPEDYGAVSIVLVFITFCDVFVTSGFGTALVQKQEASQEDYNTAFTMSLILAVVLYVVLYVSAPRIAHFYSMPILKPVVRVLGIRVIITAINTIQHAIIQREMAFRKFFFATLIGTLISCAVGIIMACSGFGVWALVAQYLTNSTIDTIVLFVVGTWKPRACYSRSSAKRIFSFGGRVLATNLTYTILAQISNLLIGKVFGASELAYYNQGEKYPSLIISNIDNSIQEVMLPAYSRVQNNIEELKEILRKSIRVGIYIIAPLMLGLFAISDTFVHVVLTDKWSQAVPFIRIFCLILLSRPFTASCHQAVLGIGRSDLALKVIVIVNVVKFILTMIAIFIVKDVLWVARVLLVSECVSIAGFSNAVKKQLGYYYSEQLTDVINSLLIAIIMCVVVYALHFIHIDRGFMLWIQILAGAVIYVSLSALFKLEPYIYLKNLLKEKILKKKIPAD